MNFLTFDVVKWGILIGSLIFYAIQLSVISFRLRTIDHALTLLTIQAVAPEVIEIVKGDMEE